MSSLIVVLYVKCIIMLSQNILLLEFLFYVKLHFFIQIFLSIINADSSSRARGTFNVRRRNANLLSHSKSPHFLRCASSSVPSRHLAREITKRRILRTLISAMLTQDTRDPEQASECLSGHRHTSRTADTLSGHTRGKG